MDVDRIAKVTAELLRLLLGKGISGNDYAVVSKMKRISYCRKSYSDLPSNACSTLMASLALVSKYGIPPFDWQKVMARFDEIL